MSLAQTTPCSWSSANKSDKSDKHQQALTSTGGMDGHDDCNIGKLGK
jgi:hypothetical protein